MKTIIIAALAPNRAIGNKNKLPWDIPDELARFKKLTSGNSIIMGRKTFESIGRPLPNRTNIVVSRSMPETKGAIIARSVSEAIELAKPFRKDAFIIGGAQIYEQALPLVDEMYLSHIKRQYEGDAFFPEFNNQQWTITHEEDHPEYTFRIYARA